LTGSKLKDFEDFLEAYSDKIVQKWIDYFVYHKNVELEKINTRIKGELLSNMMTFKLN